MSMTTDPAKREAFIAGLRDLADFLAAHPGVAVSEQATSIGPTAYGDYDDETRQIEAFAAAAGLEVTDDRPSGGKIQASRAFGPVTYHAFTYSLARLAETDARNSYAGNVQVDAPADLTETGRAA
jgi:hypothetical protein